MPIMPDRRDRLEKMTTKGVLIERDCLVNISEVVWSVIDNPDTPAELREKALDANDDLTWWLVYAPACDEPGKTFRMVPAGMHWQGYYTDQVEEFISGLHPMLIAEEPARVAMARFAAKAVDTQGYSTDYRLDMLSALHQVLDSFRQVAEEWAEEYAEELSEMTSETQ